MKKQRKKRLLPVAVFLLTVLLAAVGYYGVQVAQFFTDIYCTDGLEERESYLDYHRTNILLLGIDARSPNERGRTDAILVLSFDRGGKEASLLSIPRDSRVEIPDRGMDKINHAYAFGGIPLTIRTVEKFLDVPIHYYALINFEGFKDIVDNLGGVTIDVEPHVAANRKKLEPGLHKLSGAQALTYVRDRRSDSDIERVKRQQKFLKAVAKESLQVKNIARTPQILDSLGDNISTNMPFWEMVKVANMFTSTDLDTLPQGVIPGKGQTIQGISYWVVDADKKEKLLTKLGLKTTRG